MSGAWKSWTEEEISFLVDNLDKPSSYLSGELSRTPTAIQRMREKLKKGWGGPSITTWTDAEDAVIRETVSLTAGAVSQLLPGRSKYAVDHRRAELGVKAKRWSEKNPNYVGTRKLIAKSCVACGLILPAEWFWWSSKSKLWMPACSRCKVSRTTKWRESNPEKAAESERKARSTHREWEKRMQELTLPFAENAGSEYSEADHAVLADPSLTKLEKALRLRRTYSAVASACFKFEYKSPLEASSPENSRWHIDNPNAERVDEITAILVAVSEKPQSASSPQWDWDDEDLEISA